MELLSIKLGMSVDVLDFGDKLRKDLSVRNLRIFQYYEQSVLEQQSPAPGIINSML